MKSGCLQEASATVRLYARGRQVNRAHRTAEEWKGAGLLGTTGPRLTTLSLHVWKRGKCLWCLSHCYSGILLHTAKSFLSGPMLNLPKRNKVQSVSQTHPTSYCVHVCMCATVQHFYCLILLYEYTFTCSSKH